MLVSVRCRPCMVIRVCKRECVACAPYTYKAAYLAYLWSFVKQGLTYAVTCHDDHGQVHPWRESTWLDFTLMPWHVDFLPAVSAPWMWCSILCSCSHSCCVSMTESTRCLNQWSDCLCRTATGTMYSRSNARKSSLSIWHIPHSNIDWRGLYTSCNASHVSCLSGDGKKCFETNESSVQQKDIFYLLWTASGSKPRIYGAYVQPGFPHCCATWVLAVPRNKFERYIFQKQANSLIKPHTCHLSTFFQDFEKNWRNLLTKNIGTWLECCPTGKSALDNLKVVMD